MRDHRFDRSLFRDRYRFDRAALCPLHEVLRTEEASGTLLAAAAVIAPLWANSIRESYHQLWNGVVGIGIGDWEITKELRHWVNDGVGCIYWGYTL